MEVFSRRNNGIAVFLVTLCVYTKTCYRTLPPGDSSDLIIAAQQLGIAHPPGYPLLTILGKIWLILCPFRTPYALNLLNCVIAALSNLALYHFLSIGTKSEISALIGSLWFAFSNNVWEYSSQFENFALNNLLVITILYTYYSYLENVSSDGLNVKRTNTSLYYYGLAFSGLALSNQHMSLLIIAPIGCHVLFIESQTQSKINFKKSAKFLFAPLSIYLYLPFSAMVISTPWKWGHCQSFVGFLMHIMRMDYGSFILSHQGTVGSRSPYDIMRHFFVLMKWEFYGMFGSALAIAGVINVLRNRQNFFGRMAFGVFVISLLTFGVMIQSDPYLPLNTGIISRLWLQPSIFYIIFVAFGVKAIIDLVIFAQSKLDRLPEVVYDLINAGFIEGCIWIGSIIMMIQVYKYSDRSQLTIFEDYTKLTMNLLPKNSLVISQLDSMGTGLNYYQLVEKYRSDIDLIDGNLLTRHWWLDNNKPYHKSVNFPKRTYGDGFFKQKNSTQILHDRIDFCRANIDRQIFICGTDDYLRFLEAQAEKVDSEFESIPWGHCDQIFIKSNYTFSDKFFHEEGNFMQRYRELETKTKWPFPPPHMTRIPSHLWEFEINVEMWFQKIRLPRAAFDAAEEAIENDDLNLALILYQQALSMYRDEIGKVLAMTPKVVKDSFWIPPEWYKNVAMIHFRMANHGGRQLFHSFKLARVEMEKFVHFSKVMRKDIHLPAEIRKIEILDRVIRSNGTKSYGEVQNDLKVNQASSRFPGGVHNMPHMPYLNDL